MQLISEFLLYEDQHGCDRLAPGPLLPRCSHAHKDAVTVFLQMCLPGECFWWGAAPCTPPSSTSPAGKAAPVTGVLTSPISQEGLGLFDCRHSKPDLCPRVVLWGARSPGEDLPQFESVTGYGVLSK